MKNVKGILKGLAVAVLALPLAAQPTTDTTASDTTRKITFSVFPLGRANWENIQFAPKGDPAQGTETLSFNSRERSIDYSYEGPLPLRFFRTSEGPEGEVLYRTVGILRKLPEDVDTAGGEIILFFEEKPDQPEGPYTLHWMLDTPERFPDESIVFFNTMPATFLTVLGEHRVSIGPGASEPLAVNEYFEEEVPIVMAIRNKENLRVVIRNKIRFSPQRRTLMILRPPLNARSLRIRTQRITEFTGVLATDEETSDSDETPDS
jgi:hypothetical protein